MADLAGRAFAAVLAGTVAACASHGDSATSTDHDAGHLGLTAIDASFGTPPPTRTIACTDEISPDASPSVDAGPDAAPSRFITQVLSFCQGTCAGFGADAVLKTVSGPPVGAGTLSDSTDVVSLGGGGSIVVGFGDNAIIDGDGVDFIVFENPFDYGNGDRYVEPGEVSVSGDGKTWTAFPCSDQTQAEPDGGWGATQCGGMHPVFSNPSNSISPFDVAHAGGDAFDLATIGVKRAKYVRIRNVVASEACPEAGTLPTKNGFDLDAIAIVNAEKP